MNKKNSKILLEEYENKFLYKRSKTNLNIQFNRIAFIFFVFVMISIIFSIQLLHLGSLKIEFGDVMLEYNFLSSPDKLLQYQSKYFEKELVKIDIMTIKEISKKNEITELTDFAKKINDE